MSNSDQSPPSSSSSSSTTSPPPPPPPASSLAKPPRQLPLGLDSLASSARSLLTAPRRSPVTTLVAAFFLLALFMYGEDVRTLAELSIDDYLYPDAEFYNVSGLPPLLLPPPTCELSRGHWVFDNTSVPAYREKECTFLTKQVTCLANGRPDDLWQYWRWQPNNCSLPVFDARRFMEAMRGKRLMFVGDSLNRNQWESLVCLVQPILSEGRKKIVKRGSFRIFYAKEYRATLEFYWAPFLVESNSDNPNFHSIDTRIIRPDRIEAHAKNWKGVDYLIFNTYIWWMNTADMKVRRPDSRDWSEHDEVPRIEVYGRVFKTWSDWLEQNVDPAKTSVFFMTISPLHNSPEMWGNPNGVRCVKETLPVLNYTEPLDLNHDMRMYDLVANVAKNMKRVPVTLIDITRMSDYRKDAHTGLYTFRQGKLLTPKQKAEPKKYSDCIHWCLPGVPDVWNQILYTRILSKSSPHPSLPPQ
ncbi:protein trichome birefringence-like 28 [Oryza brachyantha]|uniref:protein trichome birefringence-like 28 n=1 Tax=Oryza brachyantha TaxID=4533 RepID=UPI001AD97D7E|nr:protein trichome birefringence-like 28 [Oryza brachyantha]